MKKVYVLVAAVFAAFVALSVGSASFASGPCASCGPGDSVPATDDTVPSTDEVTTTAAETTTTAAETTTTAATMTTLAAAETTSSAALVTTTAAAGGVTVSSVDQAAPTSAAQVSPSSVLRDGLLPNTGTDVAIPLILASLAAGTGAATLLVRRRSNVS